MRQLLKKMGLFETEDEIEYLVSKADPYGLNEITYSGAVQLLSSHMVSHTTKDYQTIQIPVLEKFSNINN